MVGQGRLSEPCQPARLRSLTLVCLPAAGSILPCRGLNAANLQLLRSASNACSQPAERNGACSRGEAAQATRLQLLAQRRQLALMGGRCLGKGVLQALNLRLRCAQLALQCSYPRLCRLNGLQRRMVYVWQSRHQILGAPQVEARAAAHGVVQSALRTSGRHACASCHPCRRPAHLLLLLHGCCSGLPIVHAGQSLLQLCPQAVGGLLGSSQLLAEGLGFSLSGRGVGCRRLLGCPQRLGGLLRCSQLLAEGRGLMLPGRGCLGKLRLQVLRQGLRCCQLTAELALLSRGLGSCVLRRRSGDGELLAQGALALRGMQRAGAQELFCVNVLLAVLPLLAA